MHVAGARCSTAPPPAYEELVEAIESRLHLVPRYRQRLAFVPLGQGRPVWVDDPHFNVHYHVRHTALPRPGGEAAEAARRPRVLAGARSQPSRCGRCGWSRGSRAGASRSCRRRTTRWWTASPASTSRPCCSTPRRTRCRWRRPTTSGRRGRCPAAPSCWPTRCWSGRPCPAEIVRGVRATLRGPRTVAKRAGEALGRWARWPGRAFSPPRPARSTCGSAPTGGSPGWTADLAQFKSIKNTLGGTVNDVVLAAVAGALGRYMRLHGDATDDVGLKAMVPVSVRADVERGALGNRVAAMWAHAPRGDRRSRGAPADDQRGDGGVKESGQAVGAAGPDRLSGFAPPTIMSQAARLQARQRLFNLVVTNVPGPQMPLYLLGRELEAIYPMVPLADNTALGIAIMSYNGQLNFGLVRRLRRAPRSRAAGGRAPGLDRGARGGRRRALRRARRRNGAANRLERPGTRHPVTPAAREPARAPRDSRLIRAVELMAIGVASLALSIALILLLSGYFAGRDQARSPAVRAVRGRRSQTSATPS